MEKPCLEDATCGCGCTGECKGITTQGCPVVSMSFDQQIAMRQQIQALTARNELLERALAGLLLTVDEAAGELAMMVSDDVFQFSVLACDDPEEPTSTWWMTIGKKVKNPELAKYLKEQQQ